MRVVGGASPVPVWPASRVGAGCLGSEATFNPAVKLLQGGFYILDTDNRSNNPFVIKYENGLSNVAWNLADPFDAIAEYGWGRFLSNEVLPNPNRRTAVVVAPRKDDKRSLNIYPGVVKVAGVSPGWCWRWAGLSLGLTLSGLPIGLGTHLR